MSDFNKAQIDFTQADSNRVKIYQMHIFDIDNIRVKYNIDGGDHKVWDFDFTQIPKDVAFDMNEGGPLVSVGTGYFDSLHIVWRGCRRARTIQLARAGSNQGRGYTYAPARIANFYFFDDGENPLVKDMESDAQVIVNPESAEEFYSRMMPFLHDAAWQFIHAHPAQPGLFHHHRLSVSRERGRLPIGYLAREVDRHVKGGATLSRTETEELVRAIYDRWHEDGAWYKHHVEHDVEHWNDKHHAIQKVIFDKPDGMEWVVDLRKEITDNLPNPDSVADGFVEQEAEKIFDNLRGDWFTKALYGARDHVTRRKLNIEHKE